MCSYKKYLIVAPVIVVGALLFIGCQKEPAQTTNETPNQGTSMETVTVDVDGESTSQVTVEVTRIVVETAVVEVSPEPVETPVELKEIVVCLAGEPQSLYPYSSLRLSLETTHLLQAIYENMYTTLSFDYQARGIEKLPNLADGDARFVEVEVNEGDVVLDVNGEVVTLREGIQVENTAGEVVTFEGEPVLMRQLITNFILKPLVWSDGKAVSSEDSVYSFELAADPATPVSKYLIDRTAEYSSVDEHTLTWVGIPGFLDKTYFTNIWTPLPRHQWGEFTATELLSADPSNRMPLSHGPFVVSEWVDGDHIRLERNEHYYLAAEGLPKLDAVMVRFVQDPDQLLAQMLDGQCDIGTHDALGMREAAALLEADAGGLLAPHFKAGSIFEHVDFGINPSPSYVTVRPDWFEDVRVRQAFIMCTDRQGMIDDFLFGQTTVMNTYVPNIHPLYPDDVTVWPYDPEAANALLDEARYLDNDGDGIRADPGTGQPFVVTLLSTIGNDLGEKIAGALVSDLAQCGIEVEVSYLQGDVYFADGPTGPLFGRQFDLAAFPWLISNEPNCELYLSSRIPSAETNWSRNDNNNIGYNDPEFDAACEAASRLLPGMEGYEVSHQAALRRWAEQVPSIPLFLRPRAAATTPEIMNFILDPTMDSDLWNLYEIDVSNS